MRLSREEIELKERMGSCWELEIHDELASTMDQAREGANVLAASKPLLVLAKRQSAGRGRQGRSWESPEGGFYGTYVFCSSRDSSDMAGFSLTVGVAVTGALGLSRDLVQLKWPNDLVAIDGKKLGGVLIELLTLPSGIFVIIGIGLNLAERVLKKPDAVSLDMLTGRVYSPAEIAAGISNALLEAHALFLEKGFAAFKAEWMSRAASLGKVFVIDCGGERMEGIFRGVADSGALLLEINGKIREIVTGHIVRIYAADN